MGVGARGKAVRGKGARGWGLARERTYLVPALAGHEIEIRDIKVLNTKRTHVPIIVRHGARPPPRRPPSQTAPWPESDFNQPVFSKMG